MCGWIRLCRWQVQVNVYCAWRITAHLRCTQCSLFLHLMDICFLTCIGLYQISQIHTRVCDVCRAWICLDITCFYEKQCHTSIWSAWTTCPNIGKLGPPLMGAAGFDTLCTAVCERCDSSTACRLSFGATHFKLTLIFLIKAWKRTFVSINEEEGFVFPIMLYNIN